MRPGKGIRAFGALLAFSVVVSSAGPAYAQPVGLPSMGSASAVELSPEIERTLGDAIMEQGRRDPTYISDPDVNQYLTDLGRRLADKAPGGVGQPITVFSVRDPQINAFALPGGYIGINSGLLVTAKSESELASVIAHEIGHVAQRHIARGMTQQSQSSGVMMAALAGALLAALAGSADLAMGVAAFGQAAAVDRQLGFSRQAEQEADRAGFEMMRRSGFDPEGAVRMFQQLSNASRLNEGMGGNAYTSTHPLSLQRMSDMQNRVAQVGRVNHDDSPTFWYLRAKLRVEQARSGQAMQSALTALREETRDGRRAVQSAAWFGLATAAWRRGDQEAAVQDIERARQAATAASPEIEGLAISVALEQGKIEQARQASANAVQRWPNRQALALLRAQVLQKAGQDKQAVAFLDERIAKWPALPQLYQMKAFSLERLGEAVASRRAMAKYYELVGAFPTAVNQLMQARGLSKDFYVQSELDVQIRELKERLQAQRDLLERFKS